MNNKPTSTTVLDPTEIAVPQTIIRAENGDVIVADETGLRMRLSDRVIEDIAMRLGKFGQSHGDMLRRDESHDFLEDGDPPSQADHLIDCIGENIDCWDVRQRREFASFMADLPGRQGVRGFLKHLKGGGIIADTAGPLRLILAIGGTRAALASSECASYPYHVVTAADDIGAVGCSGETVAEKTAFLEGLREMSHEALVADSLLYHAQQERNSLSLYFVRAETDGSRSASELASGGAFVNLMICAENAMSAAKSLCKRIALDAVFVDFTLEDVSGNAIDYRNGMLAVFDEISAKFTELGLGAPRFFTFFDCGVLDFLPASVLEGQWELSWNHAQHDLVFVAPSYMLMHDTDARLTERGRRLRAAMSAEAIFATQRNRDWKLPVLHLAECDGLKLRVTAQCEGRLVLDPTDPFGAGDHYGFALEGVDPEVSITKVAIAQDDEKALVLTLNAPLTGPQPVLCYSANSASSDEEFKENLGALRDEFEPAMHHDLSAEDMSLLRRWALPARLPIK